MTDILERRVGERRGKFDKEHPGETNRLTICDQGYNRRTPGSDRRGQQQPKSQIPHEANEDWISLMTERDILANALEWAIQVVRCQNDIPIRPEVIKSVEKMLETLRKHEPISDYLREKAIWKGIAGGLEEELGEWRTLAGEAIELGEHAIRKLHLEDGRYGRLLDRHASLRKDCQVGSCAKWHKVAARFTALSSKGSGNATAQGS